MKKILKKQDGITLIALIITIIIMMILVGVIVNNVINANLFKTTQGAAKSTREESYYEENISAGQIYIENNGMVDINEFANQYYGNNSETIEVSKNPTHILTMGTKKYKINTNTMWKELAIKDSTRFTIQNNSLKDDDVMDYVYCLENGDTSPTPININNCIYSDLSTTSSTKAYVCGFDLTHLWNPINIQNDLWRANYKIMIKEI